MIILAAVFLFCGGTVAVVQYQYAANKRLYRAASSTFTEPTALGAKVPEAVPSDSSGEKKPSRLNDGIYRLPEVAPIKVNFEALKKVNPDVDGWIYCPDTVIDYPVMHGLSNDTYLHHSYDGTYNASGSIFVDERNQRNFADPISILYGHHMASGSMFATIGWWQMKSYLDEHPVMWLLTPEQDYKVQLYSAYDTSAYSDTYEIPPYSGGDFLSYLWNVESYSPYHIGVDLDPNAHYIVMSTCAYVFEDARSVLHGKLLPVMSAGGIPME
ncbi:MAG: class B sortase [Oscillospiraceae bacterium]|nr:class B sortase [Oscillospiraceae bacterium]